MQRSPADRTPTPLTLTLSMWASNISRATSGPTCKRDCRQHTGGRAVSAPRLCRRNSRGEALLQVVEVSLWAMVRAC